MKKLKVMSVFGTRPEAIKMAPLVKELEKNSSIESKVCVTAQHREMLDQVLTLFNIVPDYDLNLMKRKQSLNSITTDVLNSLGDILSAEKPDIILVHGDTTTTFASALAAFYNKIKVGHVEAGLRTYDKYFPFPEEMNRKLTGAIADLHFAPTSRNKDNLLKEGVVENDIFVTGNTVIDAMNYTIQENYTFENKVLNNINYNKKVIMVTAHRRENWGEGIENICKALLEIKKGNKDVEIVYLVHLNPVVRDVVYKYLDGVEGIHLLEPLDTKETHNLMKKSYFIMTDSGGIQEEAPHLGKPVLVLRDVTERIEAVEAGTVKIVGVNTENIVKEANKLLSHKKEYEVMSKAVNPYGDGKASEKIVENIINYFQSK
ncbi:MULTISPECIES: non-hydrolyzing UDP-N-acetylglucosamine 2-epimerase [Clostridium]|uniref:UDP-N-acetylglucosamine 2-epimerase (non-hydrolyzing) n=1 Tax=Clostridium novyi (strain NT) TaxID=386415 RepID=A0Q303_CLONN|nr:MULTISPECIES: UDP-N-acetylglucosamine 2-epimerase (non-hydrolyzing) [Clostridium]ABK62508.1 UDP-N-acetylglucosamine 2-epimerase [Clostridium novyi NT]KEH86371.1 UDP-N-acetylglucosamine 2-epimerase [Clostridium novyi A str. 4540]KEH87016.1 UDP-N-acetylglucosamine 2-epimerase [Clostridium novyi A str. NCTC 538]KEH91109.1 UDP-N-acetylglucosamine 2-epimerase [Clostridium novyi A str. BKT29909]KEH92354.1 UDP-N-acetylglucosamine 2-epimerase [Clostridium novyi A str. GD211209]